MEFEEILIEAPELIPMIYEAHSLCDAPANVKNQYWYKILKPKLIKMVGFHCNNDTLNSTDAYDKVYQFFIKIMWI